MADHSPFSRHENFMGVLTRIETDPDATLSTHRGDRAPVFMLRHQHFATKLEQELVDIDPERPPFYLTAEPELVWADSSFLVVPGLADASWVSFRPVNHPDHLHHRDITHHLERALADMSREDATYRIVDGFNASSA